MKNHPLGGWMFILRSFSMKSQVSHSSKEHFYHSYFLEQLNYTIYVYFSHHKLLVESLSA